MERLKFSVFNLSIPVSSRFAALRARFPRYWPGLSLKLLIVVVAIALTGILASSFLLLSSLREQFINQIEASATRSNLVLEASLEHAMLTHDTVMLNTIVEKAAVDLNGRIRIIDLGGVIRSSSLPEEVGEQIDQDAPECQGCHASGTDQAVVTAAILTSGQKEERALVSVNPIANHAECAGCHDARMKTLGLLITQAPLADLDQQMQEGFRQVALAALVTFALLVGLMIPALRKVVIDPIGELSKGVTEIGAGNLDYPVHGSSGDELGQLAHAFDGMRAQLKASRTAMAQRNQELAVLYEVALITGQLLDLGQALNRTLDILIEQLGLEVGLIYLRDNAKNRFEVIASRGLSGWQLQLIDQKRRKSGGDLTQEVATRGEPFFVPDITQDPHFVGTYEDPTGRSYINLPLKSKGKVVGTLELVSRAGQPLTSRQVKILTVVGNQIGIAIDNNSLLTETQRSAHEALTLNQLGTEVSASLELNQVLDAVARGAREALESDIGVVALLDAERQELVVKAAEGLRQEEWRGLRIPLSEDIASRWGKPMSWNQLPTHLPELLIPFFEAEQVSSLLCAPLLRADKPYGVVAALNRFPRSYVQEEVHMLTRLGQQVVIAIENARLYQQVHYLAVLEERDRLAREMHDDLAQALGYLNLKASITSDLMASGALDQAQAGLLEMKQITREAYTDTREAIFNLRNTVALGADLVSALREYLAEYSLHYGLDAKLVVEDASLANFPAGVALQLNRIIQEGLTNIRKHASAAHAWVRFERDGDQARIVIADDGRGFDLDGKQADTEEHFGLQIMRERAESVGGSVELDSQVGRGTRVVIHIPAQFQE